MSQREAFDLRNPHCRRNFRYALKTKWKYLSWWKLVATDTLNHVCP